MDIEERLRKKVKALQKKPQPEQRTEAWYKQRQTRITASEAASCLYKSQAVCEPYVKQFNLTNFKYKEHEALNPYESKEDYIIKKCSSYYGVNNFKDTVYTLWGKKYEEVANTLYARLYNTKVHEFGLINHGRLKWLAASPDGITENGVMLEIKCPKSRKIDPAAPPLYYWIQVQIQLEVCDLEHCDFLECEIEELCDEETFLAKEIIGNQAKGLVLKVEPTQTEPKYLYPPVNVVTAEDYINWKIHVMQSNPDTQLTPTYYFVSKYNVIRIERSREWFAAVRNDIKKTWELITRLQANESDFIKYKESIDLIKNKHHHMKWSSTVCLIHKDETEFMEVEQNNSNTQVDNTSLHLDVCLIHSD